MDARSALEIDNVTFTLKPAIIDDQLIIGNIVLQASNYVTAVVNSFILLDPFQSDFKSCIYSEHGGSQEI